MGAGPDAPLRQPRGGPGTRARAWVEENDAFRRRILERLRDEGPCRPERSKQPGGHPWRSSGWTADGNVTQMFHFLERAGEVMVSRHGNERLWDLPERAWTPREDLPEEGLLHQWISSILPRSLSPAVRRRAPPSGSWSGPPGLVPLTIDGTDTGAPGPRGRLPHGAHPGGGVGAADDAPLAVRPAHLRSGADGATVRVPLPAGAGRSRETAPPWLLRHADPAW